MRSFPSMVDMRRDKEETPDKFGVLPCGTEAEYDYGLGLSFNEETLEKLELDEDVHVGDYIHIHAFAKVTGVHQNPGEDKPDRVDLVLTHIASEDEDDEGEEDDE